MPCACFNSARNSGARAVAVYIHAVVRRGSIRRGGAAAAARSGRNAGDTRRHQGDGVTHRVNVQGGAEFGYAVARGRGGGRWGSASACTSSACAQQRVA